MLNYSPWVLMPLFCCGFTAAGLWLVYFVAPPLMWYDSQSSGYMTFKLPYIGAAASFHPGSCIFSAVMNVSAFLLFSVAVLRYLHLKSNTNMWCLNMSSVVVFFLACIGMLITGNVPFSLYLDIANIASYITFGLALLYCWMQTYMTLKKERTIVSLGRFLLSACATVCLILYLHMMFRDFHIYAAQFQWALVMLLISFISTFAIEFRHYRFSIECTEHSGHPIKMAPFIPEVSKPLQTSVILQMNK